MYARWVRENVTRSACSMRPVCTSSNLARPARIGRPAASAEVHPSGRKALDSRSKIAPEPACQPVPDISAANNS